MAVYFRVLTPEAQLYPAHSHQNYPAHRHKINHQLCQNKPWYQAIESPLIAPVYPNQQ